MAPLAPDPLLARKLAQLCARLDRVRAKLPESADAFEDDRDAQEIVSFNFLLALQDALDVAARIIAERGWEVPTTAREHVEILAAHHVISRALARDLAAGAGARKLIAHSYDAMDLRRLHAELPSGVAALEAFAAAIAARPD